MGSQPSSKPSLSLQPSSKPSLQPSSKPSLQPSSKPSIQPSSKPSPQPSSKPSLQPSSKPSLHPSSLPSLSLQPSLQPSSKPSLYPSSQPSHTCEVHTCQECTDTCNKFTYNPQIPELTIAYIILVCDYSPCCQWEGDDNGVCNPVSECCPS